MNKLYLAMLSSVFVCANINAEKIDDPRAKIPLTGNEHIHEFTGEQGRPCAVISLHPVKTEVLKRALKPSANNVHDFRELEIELGKQILRNNSWFRRHRGKLGLAVGITAGSTLMLSAMMLGFMDSYKW